MRLLVIDGNSIANRAFYGIKLLTTKDGRYTNAIYGFLNILLSLLKECQPDEVAVAFDLKAPTFRHKMYDGYKATRHAMPEELAQQMPVLKQLLADLGYRTVTAEGWEADDILGTLAAACGAQLRLAVASAPCLKHLTLPVRVTRRTVLQKVRGWSYKDLPQIVNTGFQVLFHSPPGVLFTFPSQYYALSVTK